MADEKTSMGVESSEIRYIMSPHPEAHIIGEGKSIKLEQPVTAEVPMPVLIQQAVDELRTEIKDELKSQKQLIQSDLQAELKMELRKGLEGDLKLNVKN